MKKEEYEYRKIYISKCSFYFKHNLIRIIYVCIMYPSLESFCLKTSLAASLMAFSGVTRVRLTAAPGERRSRSIDDHDEQQFPPRFIERGRRVTKVRGGARARRRDDNGVGGYIRIILTL